MIIIIMMLYRYHHGNDNYHHNDNNDYIMMMILSMSMLIYRMRALYLIIDTCFRKSSMILSARHLSSCVFACGYDNDYYLG